MANNIPIKFAISQRFPCGYLPTQQEQLLLAIDDIVYTPANYERLMAIGFRRSGQQVYRPHCEACNACQSIRLPVQQQTLTKSQKRVLKKNKHLVCRLNTLVSDGMQYYPLYERYINLRHKDGSMYPPDITQYQTFVTAGWLQTAFLEIYDQSTLIGISVLDVLPNALSAVYTFFEPDYERNSLGKFAILKAIEFTQAMNNEYLYLGYQVDECQKMNYKTQYFPHERLIGAKWQLHTR